MIDQLGDAIDLGGDQPGQRAVRLAQLAVEQLRGATNAGERILDFVGQDLGRTQGAGLASAGAGHVIAEPFHAAHFVQDQHLPARMVLHRRGHHVERAGAPAGQANAHAPRDQVRFGIGQAMQDQRLFKIENVDQRLADQAPRPLAEQLFGRRIDRRNRHVGRQQQYGQRKAGDHALGIGPHQMLGAGAVQPLRHAASRWCSGA